mmetsp:Transcript_6538/g.18234  ORF Transcript_6538/g.18234 Transcript_6538/m.18234 type:complete len:257 (+) Transcript_6538:221-991(+)
MRLPTFFAYCCLEALVFFPPTRSLKRRLPESVVRAKTTPRRCPRPTTPTTRSVPFTALERFSDHARYKSLSCTRALSSLGYCWARRLNSMLMVSSCFRLSISSGVICGKVADKPLMSSIPSCSRCLQDRDSQARSRVISIGRSPRTTCDPMEEAATLAALISPPTSMPILSLMRLLTLPSRSLSPKADWPPRRLLLPTAPRKLLPLMKKGLDALFFSLAGASYIRPALLLHSSTTTFSGLTALMTRSTSRQDLLDK